MISFAYGYVLLLLLPLLGLFYYVFFYRPIATIQISSVNTVKRSGVGLAKNALLSNILFLSGMILLIVALARPRYSDETVKLRSEGIDIALVLDLSGSMNIFDVPDSIATQNALVAAINDKKLLNRVDYARNEIEKFIRNRPNDRIGLIGFATVPYSMVPLTLDHEWLLGALKSAKPGFLGDSTNLASPVVSAVNKLSKVNTENRKVIVLFTDGRNNTVDLVTPQQAAMLAKNKNIVIYTVGIGSKQGVIIQPSFWGDNELVPVKDDFDSELLAQMAQDTQGKYFHVSDEKSYEEAMNQINQLEKTSLEQPKNIKYREYGPTLIYVALVLLLLGILDEKVFHLRLP